MSKIEIINSFKRYSNVDILKDNDFYRRLEFINKELLSDSNRYNDNTGFEGYGELVVLPDGFSPVTGKYRDNTYIEDCDNALYKIIYYPGLSKENEDDMDTTSVITKIPKYKVYLEREYILERSAFLTEDKYGKDNPNQLLTALENIKEGKYNHFTNREHGRENLKQVPPEEINQLMRQILYKYDLINENEYIKESDLRELFVYHIKNKVKKYRKENNVLSLTELLTNVNY